ncbi:hypothetical protein Q9299_04055 [Gemmobacter fulvus]|uniref:hypothetical protein n=1 Tax=Gemmobacter fulvus TaxID=2840474 RepID=UPI002796A5CC|nr:hypothetical protein [Gemmobacter fulvus]MDQ1847452.1 hypothetical protein [Gemmobacter fulvus]
MRLSVFALLLSTLPCHASSDEAWEQFRTDVHAACLAALGDTGTAVIEVNPFGSESYGAALVTVSTGTAAERMVCVFDKQSGKAELTGTFPG